MPGKLATALTNLAALAVTGVSANYDVGAAPGSLVGVTLPVLIVLPQAQALRSAQFDEFAVASVTGSSAIVAYKVTHALIHSRWIAGRLPWNPAAGLDDLIDNYATAVRGNPSLSGALYVPTTYKILVSPIPWGGLLYYGARFFHELKVET